MMTSALTQHARTRASQRGIYHEMIDAVLTHADHEVSVGGGCYAIQLSRKQVRDHRLKARIGSGFDRLEGVVVVCCTETGDVVTVLHDCGSAARRYRKN